MTKIFSMDNAMKTAGGLAALPITNLALGTTLALNTAVPAIAIYVLSSSVLNKLSILIYNGIYSTTKFQTSFLFRAIKPLAFALTMALLSLIGLSSGNGILLPLIVTLMLGKIFSTAFSNILNYGNFIYQSIKNSNPYAQKP